MKPVVFAGSFDPVTNGHLDLIKRARDVFGQVAVVVCCNACKQARFTVQERVAFLKEALQEQACITVQSTHGLLTDFMKEHGYTTLVRGLRSAHDWNHERTQAYFNKRLYPAMQTVFLPADEKYQFVSSSAVKEAAGYGADVNDLVPPCVAEAFKKKK